MLKGGGVVEGSSVGSSVFMTGGKVSTAFPAYDPVVENPIMIEAMTNMKNTDDTTLPRFVALGDGWGIVFYS